MLPQLVSLPAISPCTSLELKQWILGDLLMTTTAERYKALWKDAVLPERSKQEQGTLRNTAGLSSVSKTSLLSFCLLFLAWRLSWVQTTTQTFTDPKDGTECTCIPLPSHSPPFLWGAGLWTLAMSLFLSLPIPYARGIGVPSTTLLLPREVPTTMHVLQALPSRNITGKLGMRIHQTPFFPQMVKQHLATQGNGFFASPWGPCSQIHFCLVCESWNWFSETTCWAEKKSPKATPLALLCQRAVVPTITHLHLLTSQCLARCQALWHPCAYFLNIQAGVFVFIWVGLNLTVCPCAGNPSRTQTQSPQIGRLLFLAVTTKPKAWHWFVYFWCIKSVSVNFPLTGRDTPGLGSICRRGLCFQMNTFLCWFSPSPTIHSENSQVARKGRRYSQLTAQRTGLGETEMPSASKCSQTWRWQSPERGTRVQRLQLVSV